jgi:hypothetical protein
MLRPLPALLALALYSMACTEAVAPPEDTGRPMIQVATAQELQHAIDSNEAYVEVVDHIDLRDIQAFDHFDGARIRASGGASQHTARKLAAPQDEAAVAQPPFAPPPPLPAGSLLAALQVRAAEVRAAEATTGRSQGLQHACHLPGVSIRTRWLPALPAVLSVTSCGCQMTLLTQSRVNACDTNTDACAWAHPTAGSTRSRAEARRVTSVLILGPYSGVVHTAANVVAHMQGNCTGPLPPKFDHAFDPPLRPGQCVILTEKGLLSYHFNPGGAPDLWLDNLAVVSVAAPELQRCGFLLFWCPRNGSRLWMTGIQMVGCGQGLFTSVSAYMRGAVTWTFVPWVEPNLQHGNCRGSPRVHARCARQLALSSARTITRNSGNQAPVRASRACK